MYDAGAASLLTVRVRQFAEPDAVDNLAKRTVVAVVMVAVGGARSAGRPARIVGSQQIRGRARESQRVGLPSASRAVCTGKGVGSAVGARASALIGRSGAQRALHEVRVVRMSSGVRAEQQGRQAQSLECAAHRDESCGG